jgi:hypothetical protein
MGEQQQQIQESNLNPQIATAAVSGSTTESGSSDRLESKPLTGLEFATALRARVDGSRPIVEDVIFATLDWEELATGKNWLKIEHSSNREDWQKPYYATSITNISTEPIRIDRFGTYIQTGKTLVLHSITGGFCSSQQFQEWYNLGQSQWIAPRQTVGDPNNHSSLGVYWAYFGTTASGQQFVAGAPWSARRWWQLWD